MAVAKAAGMGEVRVAVARAVVTGVAATEAALGGVREGVMAVVGLVAVTEGAAKALGRRQIQPRRQQQSGWPLRGHWRAPMWTSCVVRCPLPRPVSDWAR